MAAVSPSPMSTSAISNSGIDKAQRELEARTLQLAELIPHSVSQPLDDEGEGSRSLGLTLAAVNSHCQSMRRILARHQHTEPEKDPIYAQVLQHVMRFLLRPELSRLCRLLSRVELALRMRFSGDGDGDVDPDPPLQKALADTGRRLKACLDVLTACLDHEILPYRFLDPMLPDSESALMVGRVNVGIGEETNDDLLERLKSVMQLRSLSGSGFGPNLADNATWEQSMLKLYSMPHSRLWSVIDAVNLKLNSTRTLTLPPIETNAVLSIRSVPLKEIGIEPRVQMAMTQGRGKSRRRPELHVVLGVPDRDGPGHHDTGGSGSGSGSVGAPALSSSQSQAPKPMLKFAAAEIQTGEIEVDADAEPGSTDAAIDYALRLAGIDPGHGSGGGRSGLDSAAYELDDLDLQMRSGLPSGTSSHVKADVDDGDDDWIQVNLDETETRASLLAPLAARLHFAHSLPSGSRTIEADVVLVVPGAGMLGLGRGKADGQSGSGSGSDVDIDIGFDNTFAHLLAVESGACVITVEYRRPPAHRYPAQQNDVWCCYTWAALHLTQIGIVPRRISIVGAGAGAAVAVDTVLRCIEDAEKSNPIPFPACCVLVSPVLDAADSPSFSRLRAMVEGQGQGSIVPRLIRAHALPQGLADVSPSHYKIYPIRIPAPILSRFPRTVTVVGQRDALRDDGLLFSARLRDLGVTSEASIVTGVGFGFLDALHFCPELRVVVKQIAGFVCA